jgi:hypothetical protein
MLRRALNSAYPRVPDLLPLSSDVNRAGLARLLQASAAWAGTVHEAEALGGDGFADTSVRLAGTRRDLVIGVRLAVDSPPGPNGQPRVASVTLRPLGE